MSTPTASIIEVDQETPSPDQVLDELPADLTIFTSDDPPHIQTINQAIIEDQSMTPAARRIFRKLTQQLDHEDKICLSPRTALSALSAPSLSLQNAKDIAIGLANTAEARRTNFLHQTDLYAQAVDKIQKELDDKRAVPDDPPYGFVHNDNRVPYFVIYDAEHQPHLAPYIRKCPGDPTTVIGTLGGPNHIEYTCPIYATSHHSDGHGLSALPPWFVELLHAKSHHTDTLVLDTYKQDDWGLATDIHAYAHATRQLHELYRQQDAIRLQIQAMSDQQGYVQHRLERAQAPSRLQHLRPLARDIRNDDDDGFTILPRPPFRKHNRGQFPV
jgi:hypothetical protein